MSYFADSGWTASPQAAGGGIDERPRLRLFVLALVCLIPLGITAGRAVYLQTIVDQKFLDPYLALREEFADLPPLDGRIFSYDGTLLAVSEERWTLSVHYRWLEEPAQDSWLREQALGRLSRSSRKSRPAVEQARLDVLQERDALWKRLAALSGRDVTELTQWRRRIQQRVESIRASVEARKLAAVPAVTTDAQPTTLREWWGRVVKELTTAPRREAVDPLVIAEELDYHLLEVELSDEAAQEIASHPGRYPGVRVISRPQRHYPERDLAAHVVGVRTPVQEKDLAETKEMEETSKNLSFDYRLGDTLGRSGAERSYEQHLRGLRGVERLQKNRRGEIVHREVLREPRHGVDLTLTVDTTLQRMAETFLDQALETETPAGTFDVESSSGTQVGTTRANGGCVIVMDVRDGTLLVAAAAPRFDLNLLVNGRKDEWQKVLDDPRKPLFPRLTQMAIPPGSVFKPVTAIALLEAGLSPGEPFYCQGYLDRPNQYRCLCYRHQQVGHGETDLTKALEQSCNVYFYSHARRTGGGALFEWAHRLGMGLPTGIDLPGESAGELPSILRTDEGLPRERMPATLGLSIGQSTLRTTPLQIVRAMAAIANGGSLVTPKVAVNDETLLVDDHAERVQTTSVAQVPGLHVATLKAIRIGMEQVVSSPQGTAYRNGRVKGLSYAAKTGTAETGGGRPDHAWFAGYAPAESPKYAFCVVVEHGGSGGRVAAPIMRELLTWMMENGRLP